MRAEGDAPPPAPLIVRHAGERIEIPERARLVTTTRTPAPGELTASGAGGYEESGSSSTSKRSGRRPGTSDTREAIAQAAREQFAEVGFDRATMRKPRARLRILKKLPRASGNGRARARHRLRRDRNLVRR